MQSRIEGPGPAGLATRSSSSPMERSGARISTIIATSTSIGHASSSTAATCMSKACQSVRVRRID